MKKFLLLSLVCAATLTASAQYYPDGRPIPPRHRNGYNGYNGYSSRNYDRGFNAGNTYYGLHVGMAVGTIRSDAELLDGTSPKVGLDVGVDVGTRIVPSAPVFFETGLSFVQKGGKGEYKNEKFTYGLNYLEMPLLLKYKYYASPGFSIEPHVGGYLALGVGGTIKDYAEREAYSSFGSDEASFKRFDGGLRLGCGLSYNALHFALSYDIGLANVGNYDFEYTHTGALNLSVGVRF